MSDKIDWSIEELQEHIDQIIYGEKLISVVDINRDKHYFIFKYPSKKDFKLSEVEYHLTEDRAKKDNFQTEDQMLELMVSKGIWTEKDDEKLEDINESIKKWQEKATNPDISDSAKVYINEMLEKLEADMWEVEKKREVMLIHTVERKARQAKYNYLLWACTYKPGINTRIGDNYLTFCEMLEDVLRNDLLNKFLQYLAGHNTAEIRYIARNNLWRISYVSAAKANMPLFPVAVSDLTPDQLNLVWWSGYYQGIYEMMPEDQPEDWVVEDDELLDKHMQDLHTERTKDFQSKRSEKKYGTRTAMKMPEALVFKSHPDYERLKYDEIPEVQKGVKKNATSVELRDDPQMKGERRKRAKEITKSRRFKK